MSGSVAKGPAGRKCSSAVPPCGRSCSTVCDDARLAVIKLHDLDARRLAQPRTNTVAGDQQPASIVSPPARVTATE